jgi:putative acetyltransferase
MPLRPATRGGVFIRVERPEDREAVFVVNREAFGGEFEPKLVDGLRKTPAFIPELSLVATVDGAVAGYILFIRLVILNGPAEYPALGLAPLAVEPSRQNRGIGTALVRAGLAAGAKLGHRLVFVVGRLQYYGRFGFLPARARGFEVAFPVPDDGFMVRELVPGAMHGLGGLVKHPIIINS